MIDGLKPYPAMKDSGVSWLGEVPKHWNMRRLRNTVDMRVSNVDKHTKDGEIPVRLCNYVDVYKNDRITDRVPFMRATALPGEIDRFRLQLGDVLITKDSEVWDDIGVPALVEYAADDLICGYHLALLRPFEFVEGRFLFRALQSNSVAYQFHVEANGVTRYGLSHAAIKSIWLPIAPLAEQSAIIRFLDHADGRIRRYIRAKQKLIKLLEEEKRAIVHRAVTQGIDSNARLKPSGIEWLGDVPEHWEIRREKYSFREIDDRSVNGTEELMSVSHKTGVTPRSEKNITMFKAESYVGHKLCRPGDIVVNTMWAWMAAIGVSERIGIVSPSYGVYRPQKEDEFRSPFLDLLLRTEAYRHEYIRGSRGITSSRLRLYPDDFLRILFIRPPLNEQDDILLWVKSETAESQRAIDVAVSEIALLREFRTRLIADVVTGKIDVREATARLPEEVPEVEPLDEMEDMPEDEGVADDDELAAADAA